MKIAIIKYNAGNIHSVRLALQREGIEPLVTDDPDQIQNADKVIFPGVGEASTAMDYLKQNGLDQIITNLTQPFLGICLGLQLMCAHSEENDTECLGIFDNQIKKFPPKDKVPHMGWNTISNLSNGLFKGIKNGSYVYFVHSFYAELSETMIAQTEYILPYASALQKDNYYAVQFHPEKSGKVGAQILRNFLDL
ncbi:MAG: imidazole glycerol phosphate synthase subunit HisH [Calditrichaceae bacterium]|nr:imidazole glycerol phosphate synthase subunit HisH [Calditrichaceae bacterium]HES59057.1 imidazole glycerol phosphate synthase subunit HisH [Caldithrix sp.]